MRQIGRYMALFALALLLLLINPAPALETVEQAGEIDWVSDPLADNLCQGYYQEPDLRHNPLTKQALIAGKTVINGGATNFSQVDTSSLENIIVSQPDSRLEADQAYLFRDAKTGKINVINAYGHVSIREPGKLLLGEHGTFQLDDKSGQIWLARYHISLASRLQIPASYQTGTNTAWGKASTIQQFNPNLLQLTHASYTTCSPLNTEWFMRAQKIVLDKISGRGTAHNVFLYMLGAPVFYTPYANFPIDNRRESGFLYPGYNYDTPGGFSFTTPFYFNLAPNVDFTFTPQFFTKRGMLFDGLFRYLTPYDQGSLTAVDLPHDRAFAAWQKNVPINYAAFPQSQITRTQELSDNRKMFSYHDFSHFGPHWSSALDFNYASDDYFFQDFPNYPVQDPLAIQNQLSRQAQINYADEIWNVNALVQSYQTLHPLNFGLNAVLDQYSRLPQVSASGDFPNGPFGLHFAIDAQAVRFSHAPESFADPYSGLPFANGSRFNIAPSISLPLMSMSGFFIPNIQLMATHYGILSEPAIFSTATATSPSTLIAPARLADQINRLVPSFNIDSGLVFERDTHLFSQRYTQTIEPRVFYLFVPVVDQNAIPNFDSSLLTFTYDQLFSTNRFTGIDRIGDADQLAIGVTSRMLDGDTGQEKVNVGIGEMFYFRHRLVSLCSNPYNAYSPDCIKSENPIYKEPLSPLVGTLTYGITPSLSITGNIAWDSIYKNINNAAATISWVPWPRHGISVGYSYNAFQQIVTDIATTNPFYSVNLAGTWPLPFWRNWSALGILNYAAAVNKVPANPLNRTQTYYYGIQYDSCCWAMRVVAGRTFNGYTATTTENNQGLYDRRIFVQFLLKGLGSVGSSGGSQAVIGIPGFYDIFARD